MDFLSSLQKKYSELLAPVQQGLSQVGKAINSNPIAKNLANTAGRAISPILSDVGNFTNTFSQAPHVDLTSRIQNPVFRFGASIPESIINSPRNTAEGMQGLQKQASDMYLKGQLPRPQTLLSNVGKSVDLPLNLMGGEWASNIGHSIVNQGFEQLGKQGLKQIVKKGLVEGGLLGGGFGLSSGLQSGENINKPLDYATNLGINTLEGAAGGAILGGLGAGGMYGINKGVNMGINTFNKNVEEQTSKAFKEKLVNLYPHPDKVPYVASIKRGLDVTDTQAKGITDAVVQFKKGNIGDSFSNDLIQRATDAHLPQFKNKTTIEQAHIWDNILDLKDGNIPQNIHPEIQKIIGNVQRDIKSRGFAKFDASVGGASLKSDMQTKQKTQAPTVKEFVNQSPVLETKIPSNESLSQSHVFKVKTQAQIKKEQRAVDPFVAEMDAQVGKPLQVKPKKQPLKLKGNEPQYSQSDSNFESGRAQMNSEENQGRFKQLFAEWVGKRESAQTTGTQIGSEFKDIPKKDFRGFAQKVEMGEPTKYADKIRAELDQIYSDAQNNGIEMGYRENYLPHVWDKSQTQVAQDYKIFKKREGFQNERTLPTYEEGIKMGLKPKYGTVGELTADYATKIERLKANLDFFKKLKDEGFIVDASIGTRQPGFQALDGPGFPRSVSVGADGQKIIGNYYAPTDIARQVNRVFSPSESPKMLGFVRKVSGVAQDVTLSGGIPGTPFNAFTVAQAQKELLAGRIKSPIASFFRSISPGKSLEFFKNNVGQIKKMQENNIPIHSSFDIGNFVEGGDKGNIWNRAVNDPTFKRFMPQLQINLFNDIEKQALKGGKTASEATAIAAKAVKQFYGVTGSEKEILRGQLGKDLLGATTFAPKFRESMVNFWINSVKALKNPTALENRANIKFLAGAALTLGVMDYLNNQLNGHHMWDNPKGKEDKLLIPLGNGTVVGVPFLSSIATIPRAMVREIGTVAKGDVTGAITDAGSTYASVIAKPIFDVAKNSDYFGKEIVSENDSTTDKFNKIGKYMLTQYLAHPYLKETIDSRNSKDPMYQRISRALELPIRYYSQKSIDSAPYFAAKDEAYQRLDKVQQAAFDAIPKQDPNDVQARQFKYLTMLQYPQVFNAKKEIALKSDKNVDPLYTVPYSQARVYMLYEAQNPGSADKKALYKAHPEIGQLAQARADFFAANPIEGGQTSGAPRPSARAQALMDAGNFKDAEVKAFLDANTAYQNQQRAQLGLTQLAGYTPYQRKPKQIKLKAIAIKFPKSRKIKVTSIKTKKVKQYKLGKVTKVSKLKA